MNIAEIIKSDISNGTGIRLSVFVSGCRIRCKGCFQPHTWDFNYGRPYDNNLHKSLMNELEKPQYTGLSILGGEPLEPENQPDVLRLCKRFKEQFPEKTIWLYTGCEKDTLTTKKTPYYTQHTDEILSLIDVIVTGPYREDQADISLRYRGSRNQKLYNLKETRELRSPTWLIW